MAVKHRQNEHREREGDMSRVGFRGGGGGVCVWGGGRDHWGGMSHPENPAQLSGVHCAEQTPSGMLLSRGWRG